MQAAADMYPDYMPVVASAPASICRTTATTSTGNPHREQRDIRPDALRRSRSRHLGHRHPGVCVAEYPQVVCYRANGVKLSYKIMEKILKVPFVSLPNLIADAPIVPEMLVHLCTPKLVGRELGNILPADGSRQSARRLPANEGNSRQLRCSATHSPHNSRRNILS